MKMTLPRSAVCLPLVLATINVVVAAGVRDHTRLKNNGDTAVTSTQAADLTLTLSAVAVRPVQTWIRTAGNLDKTGQTLNATLYPPEASLVNVGQRVRAFSLASRSSMYQARVTRVTTQAERSLIDITLAAKPAHVDSSYLLEIVTEQGQFLSIPNEAIIDEGARQLVYVQQRGGDYTPKEIKTGVQGELYTQVLSGVTAGDQVVTIGSFFIDAEHKMKGSD